MKPITTLFLLAGLAACTQPGSSSAVSEHELQETCEAFVSAETGVRPEDVSAISTDIKPTGSVTTVSVVGSEKPWSCVADPFGTFLGFE